MAVTPNKVRRVDLGRQDSVNPRFRMLHAIHEEYAKSLGNGLSASLRADLDATVGEISFCSAGRWIESLPNPTCLLVLKLQPIEERMFLQFDLGTVFTLLELLLGGHSGPLSEVERGLTDIEWSLLEDVVRVMLRPLGEAWKFFQVVEFEVESLVNEPGLFAAADPAQTLARLNFNLHFGEASGHFQLVLPQTFFDAGLGISEQDSEARQFTDQDYEQRLGRLERALVGLDVRLEGPTLALRDLAELKTGQVLSFRYPLERPLSGLVNGVKLEGQIVSAGNKRAFQVTTLPVPQII